MSAFGVGWIGFEIYPLNEEGSFGQVVVVLWGGKAKFVEGCHFLQVRGRFGWSFKGKHSFMMFVSFMVKNNERICFWLDPWCSDIPL